MNYKKSELKKKLKDSTEKTDSNTKLIRYLLLLILMPVIIMVITIYIVNPRFWGSLLVFGLLIVNPMVKMIKKKVDVECGLVDIDNFLVLGNISTIKPGYYAWDNKTINPTKYHEFFIPNQFLSNSTLFKKEYLNHHIVSIKASRLRYSKKLVEIFEITIMDTDRIEIFEHIFKNIYKDKTYKNKKAAEKVYQKYLKEVSKIYADTRVKSLDGSTYQSYWRIKNIERNLEENPRPFIDFVMYEGYEFPICHRYNLDGEKLGEVVINESNFAKMLYYDILEAVRLSYKASSGKYDSYHAVERM